MIFEKEKYYKQIKDLESIVNITYLFVVGFFALMGLTKGVMGFIVLTGIGFLISWCITFATQVKIQEMKWKFDMYEKAEKIERGRV